MCLSFPLPQYEPSSRPEQDGHGPTLFEKFWLRHRSYTRHVIICKKCYCFSCVKLESKNFLLDNPLNRVLKQFLKGPFTHKNVVAKQPTLIFVLDEKFFEALLCRKSRGSFCVFFSLSNCLWKCNSNIIYICILYALYCLNV